MIPLGESLHFQKKELFVQVAGGPNLTPMGASVFGSRLKWTIEVPPDSSNSAVGKPNGGLR
jgi:hypothetical protein